MESHTDLLKHIFFNRKIPEDYSYGFTPGFFHQEGHLKLQGLYYYQFYILHRKKRKVVGHIFFHQQDFRGVSPKKASYGGIETTNHLDLRIIFSFVEYFQEELKADGILEIQITLPPTIYNLNTYTKLQDIFFQKDYQLISSEIGATLIVAEDNFNDKISKHLKRRLKQCKEKNFKAAAEDISDLEKIYSFIKKCRRKKGQHLSMTFDEVLQTAEALPEGYKCFTLYDNDRLIAASLAIQISPSILYNFYSAHDAEYNKFSPMIMLFDYVYSYCIKKRIQMVDLGTSAISGKPNFSLLHFKEHLGAVFTPKHTYYKKLT